MNHYGSATLILFLLDKLPFKEQRYVYYWLGDNKSKYPFKPSGVTTNIEGYKQDIAELLKGEVNLTTIKKIGEKIKDNFGLKLFFNKLFDERSISKLTIMTNDVEVPWEWVYNYGENQFLCEKYSLGKVFVADVEKHSFDKESIKTDGFDVSEQSLQKMKVLFFFDKGGGNKYKLDEIEEVEKEMINLERIFIDDFQLSKSNLKIIDGSSKNAEQEFFEYLKKNKDLVKIIHYSGHVEDDSLIFSTNRIDASEIYTTLYGDELNNPLVFINGCRSGKIDNIWKSENNIATAFLHRGAANVICTNRDIHDNPAKEFSQIFYSNLLHLKNYSLTISDILRMTRESYKEKYQNEDIGHWLFYTLYGDAQVNLFPMDPNILMRKTVDPSTEDAIRAVK